ncbi:MAG: N-acetylneuraminate synthase family protein, partial [Patescibacteria group bacterium]
IRDLNTVGLAKPGEVYDTKLVSLPYVYPMLAKGSEEALARVRGAVASYQQVFLIGTGGDYHYADLQILAVKGRDLADRIAGVSDEEEHLVRGNGYSEHFANEVVLGTHTVAYGKPAFVIAEIGLNHNGSLELAKKLISAAKLSGASAAKLQSFSAGSRLSQKVKENRYAEELIDTEEGMFSMFKRLELTESEHAELFAYAQSIDMVLFSTPFDIESLELLEAFGAPFYKIASMDVVNLPLVRTVAETGKPIIMSTGMSSLAEIEDAVEVIQSTGNKNLILLQCVSSYPAVPQDMNLAAMKTLHKAFGVPVGFSDHTIGLIASTVALSLGATVIERHFTLDRFMEGPDHILSSEPHELTELVELSRLVPLIRGTGEKRVQGSEIETMNRFKKGLYAKVDIHTGDTITETMLTIKGPGGAVLPKFQSDVVGKTARIDIPADHPVKWDHFQ